MKNKNSKSEDVCYECGQKIKANIDDSPDDYALCETCRDKSKNNGLRVLDIGCGERFRGTDRIDLIKTISTTLVHDAESGLPYDNKTFDRILCLHVLGHIRNVKFFMEECYRVLKDGGKMILKTSNAGFILYHIRYDHNDEVELMKKEFKEKGLEDGGDWHYHLFVPSHLFHIFEKAGFENIEIKYKNPYITKFKKFITDCMPYNLGKQVLLVEAFKPPKEKDERT